MLGDSLPRLHRALVDALRHSRNHDFAAPITVSEIYQQLIPYRAARNLIGFEMNADYEHALLRLLAGEGDYAQIEPAEVREQLRLELDSPNPDVTLFRRFANCDVYVAPDPGQFAPRSEPPAEVLPEAAPPDTRADTPAQTTRPGRLCPHCGQSLEQESCSKCGKTLEPDWHFCAYCGTPAARRA